MSHKITIIAEVFDDADYNVIRDHLSDFPEVSVVYPIIVTQQEKKELSREGTEIRLRIINAHQFHNPETGFKEWKPGTPQYVKNLFGDIIKEQTK